MAAAVEDKPKDKIKYTQQTGLLSAQKTRLMFDQGWQIKHIEKGIVTWEIEIDE